MSNTRSNLVSGAVVRMVNHEWVTAVSLGRRLSSANTGCTAQTLDKWVKRAEVNSGVRAGLRVLPRLIQICAGSFRHSSGR